MQVDFTWLAIIGPHRSSPDRVRQCTPKASGALTSLEVRVEHPFSRDELAQQLFQTEALLRPGRTRPHKLWLLGSQQEAARKPLAI